MQIGNEERVQPGQIEASREKCDKLLALLPEGQGVSCFEVECGLAHVQFCSFLILSRHGSLASTVQARAAACINN